MDDTEYIADYRFVMLKDYPMFTIDPVYPHYIKKKSGGFTVEQTDEEGYVRVFLNGVKCYKHRLIAEHFIPNPERLPYVDHFNQDRSDNHVSNLRWIGPLEAVSKRQLDEAMSNKFKRFLDMC